MKTTIVAEIGINHGGDLNKAMELVNLVAGSRVDVVKFQMVNPDLVYKRDDPLYKIFDKVKFNMGEWAALKRHTETRGLEFLCTPGDIESVDRLDKLGVKRFKIASDSSKNIGFVNYVASKGKPYIVSMGTHKDFSEIVNTVKQYHVAPQFLLHCVSKYPTPQKEANFRLLKELVSAGYPTGYSDHVPGYEASLVAVVLGAKLIEKHVMLTSSDIDAPVSLFIGKFKRMVHEIEQIEELI